MRFKPMTLAAMAAAILAVSASIGDAGDGIQFGYRLKKGVGHKFKVKLTQEVAFGSFTRSAFIDAEFSDTCVGTTKDGKFKMEMTFSKVDASVMMFDKMQETDIPNQLVGQVIGYTVDEHGDVDDVISLGYIEQWESLEGHVKSIIGSGYIRMPGEEYAEGEEWEDDETEPADETGMEFKTHGYYKFEKMEMAGKRNCAVVKSEIEMEVSGVNENPMGTFDASGEGTGKSEVLFDPGDSMIVKAKVSMEINMDMKPQSGQGDVVETTVSYNVERELL